MTEVDRQLVAHVKVLMNRKVKVYYSVDIFPNVWYAGVFLVHLCLRHMCVFTCKLSTASPILAQGLQSPWPHTSCPCWRNVNDQRRCEVCGGRSEGANRTKKQTLDDTTEQMRKGVRCHSEPATRYCTDTRIYLTSHAELQSTSISQVCMTSIN